MDTQPPDDAETPVTGTASSDQAQPQPPKKRSALADRRNAIGFTQKALAKRLGVSEHAVTCWERGINLPKAATRPALAEALQVNMVELGRLLGIEPEVSIEEHRVQQWLSHYDSLVLGSRHTAKIDILVLPDLLQTMRYATVIEETTPGVTDVEVAERVANRLRRQQVLVRQPDPLELVAIIYEPILRTRMGGPEVMPEQLFHLSLMAGRPNIEILILPNNEAATPAVSGFELLTKTAEQEPFMAVTLDMCGAHYHEGFIRRPFLDMYSYLRSAAMTPEDSASLINEIQAEHGR